MVVEQVKGITFDYQTQTAASMGVILRAAFGKKDGILEGCDVTIPNISGVKIDKGDILICGRHLQVTDEFMLPTNGFNSPGDKYCRILLQLDMSNTASADEFTQAEILFKYSQTSSVFPSLIQEDINHDGTIYQAEICTVSLDTGGHPTSIIHKWQPVSNGLLLTT
ncbi:MAG: hypothetical protein IJO77_02840 [Oscillospiraceae bacterium]|nr:hypothetical protein [Oscillospiraceae bacterium]